MQLFWRQGYEPTSLDQLQRAMGDLSPASFYGAFGSKEKLYREALARYLGTYGQVVAPLHDAASTPRDALEQALRRSVQLQTDPDMPRGCMLVLSVANASPENSHLQATVAAERQRTPRRDPALCRTGRRSGGVAAGHGCRRAHDIGGRAAGRHGRAGARRRPACGDRGRRVQPAPAVGHEPTRRHDRWLAPAVRASGSQAWCHKVPGLIRRRRHRSPTP